MACLRRRIFQLLHESRSDLFQFTIPVFIKVAEVERSSSVGLTDLAFSCKAALL